MVSKIKIVVFLSLIVLAFILGVENFLLKKELTASIEKYELVHTELEEINYILTLEKDIDPTSKSYYSWENSKELAKKLHIESEGQFPKEWGLFLSEKAKEHSINPYILFELIRVETGGTFNPDTVGPETKYGRAYGLAQFMENTGPWIANMADLPYEKELLYNPYYAIQLATVYLDYLYERYGDWDHALTAYHRGIYGLEKFKNKRGHAKSWYSEQIQEKAEELQLVVASK